MGTQVQSDASSDVVCAHRDLESQSSLFLAQGRTEASCRRNTIWLLSSIQTQIGPSVILSQSLISLIGSGNIKLHRMNHAWISFCVVLYSYPEQFRWYGKARWPLLV